MSRRRAKRIDSEYNAEVLKHAKEQLARIRKIQKENDKREKEKLKIIAKQEKLKKKK